MLEKIMMFCEENPVMVIALLIVLALILTASLYDMLAVIKSFKCFNRFSHDLMNQILQCNMETSEEGFEVLRKNILDYSW